MLERMDDFFNSRLDRYEEHQLHAIEQAETFYPITASHLPETPHARVLDLGCGTGLELGYYFDRNPTACVTGIDLAGDMLNALHSKFPDKLLTLVQGSYFTVPFGECCYDAVVSVESLHHFTQAEKIPLYQKVLRALIPGGCLILTDYFAESDEQEAFLRSKLLRLKAEQGIQDEEFYHYDTPLTVPHEMEALQIAGFPHVEELGRWGATHLLRAEKPAPFPNATHPIDLKSAPDARENSDRIKMIRVTDMSMLGAILTPHPPVLLPEVGNGREREISATGDAMRAAAAEVARWAPEVLIVASPHTILYGDYFHIAPGSGAAGSMAAFGAPQVRIKARYDEPLREEIIRRAERAGLQAGTLGQRDPDLDHGVLIPLYFLRKAGVNCPILRMGLSGFSALDHYRLGQCVAEAVEALGRRAVFVASGDLSHKLKADGPYGFAPDGPVFDKAVTKTMASGNFLEFLTMDPSLCKRAAECGLRSFQIMAGALDGLAIQPRLLSHEGTFGVGYGVALFPVTGHDDARRYAAACEQNRKERLAARRAKEDPWVRLARLSLETFVLQGHSLQSLPEGLPAELTEQTAGAFVSLHKDGRLRGCIGTISPTRENTAMEIVQNAISAGTRDPRFPPVRAGELDELEYSVDVLGKPEPVDSSARLDPKQYGVIVSCGRKRGLLLPDLDGVDTVEQQLEIARQKGRIGEDEPYTIQRFKVVRHA